MGDRNIEFARRWLKTESLPIVAEDVGGTTPRRVIYFPSDGKARVRHLRPVESQEIATRERAYLGKVAQQATTTTSNCSRIEARWMGNRPTGSAC